MAETDIPAQTSSANEIQQPGAVITPADPPQSSVQTPETTPSDSEPSAAPAEDTSQPDQTVPTASSMPDAPLDPSSFTVPDNGVDNTGETITWTASEFVAHEKSPSWYLLLGLGAVIGAGIVDLLTKDVISASVVVVAAIALGVYGARQPRQMQYLLDDSGVSIGQRHHQYESFRSFAIVPEGIFSSIVFMPLKRFAPLTTIYYDPKDEDQILDLLEPRLPFVEYSHDAVERLMRRIRF